MYTQEMLRIDQQVTIKDHCSAESLRGKVGTVVATYRALGVCPWTVTVKVDGTLFSFAPDELE